MTKLENLTSKIVEKSPSRAKAKEESIRKGRQSDVERASSELLSNSESELEEQVTEGEKKQKNKISSSWDKADKRKECQKGSDDKSEC